MWREIWDETVSQIYRDTLSTLFDSRAVICLLTMTFLAEMEEPVYGRIPKPDPYAALKATKKY